MIIKNLPHDKIMKIIDKSISLSLNQKDKVPINISQEKDALFFNLNYLFKYKKIKSIKNFSNQIKKIIDKIEKYLKNTYDFTNEQIQEILKTAEAFLKGTIIFLIIIILLFLSGVIMIGTMLTMIGLLVIRTLVIVLFIPKLYDKFLKNSKNKKIKTISQRLNQKIKDLNDSDKKLDKLTQSILKLIQRMFMKASDEKRKKQRELLDNKITKNKETNFLQNKDVSKTLEIIFRI